MTPLKVKCNVEPTKNDKWTRLTPVERGPLAPFVVRSDAVNGSKQLTVTITA